MNAEQERQRDRNEQGRPENARPRDRFGRPLPRGAPDELADREEPEEVVSSVPEALDKAVALFDAERFFEAHEFLEYIWKSEEVPPTDRDFWKGVTQVAVGCAHTQRGNTKGAMTLLERAASYLRPYPSPHQGIATDELIAEALRLAAEVRDAGAHEDRRFPRFPLAGTPREPSTDMASLLGLSPGRRYRCASCGNLTRFDVVSVERVRRFWHADLAGVGKVDSEERLSADVETVTCRWCGSSAAIELVAVPASATSDSGLRPRGAEDSRQAP